MAEESKIVTLNQRLLIHISYLLSFTILTDCWPSYLEDCIGLVLVYFSNPIHPEKNLETQGIQDTNSPFKKYLCVWVGVD